MQGRAGILLLGLTLFGCARSDAPPHQSGADSAAAVAFAPSVNAFGCELYRALTEATSSDITISPISLSTCLGMACAGARGATQDEMERVLHLSGDFPSRYRALKDRIEGLPARQLDVTNGIWVRKGTHLLPAYKQVVRDGFGLSPGTIDFSGDPEAGRQEVNRWFSDHTGGRVPDLLPAGTIGTGTSIVIGNAVYFVGKWREPFDAMGTRPAPFHATVDSVITLSTMHWSGDRSFARLPRARMIELDYEGDALSFLVVLPDSIDGLPDLERELTADSLQAWTSRLSPAQVDLALPKFTAKSASMLLGGTLEALGMETAFTPMADFTGMASRKPLFLDVVAHQAFVQVDEEGTIAAAATVIEATTATTPLVEREVVNIDHPFLFAIRDRATGCLLFLGRFTGRGT